MTLLIFDSDSGPLPGFTQIQYQCKSSLTWVYMVDGDKESESPSRMIQDFFFIFMQENR